MNIKDFGVFVPIRFRGTEIKFIDYTIGHESYGRYITKADYRRYDAQHQIPPASVKDKTYRTLAERRHMRYPKLRRIVLNTKTLRSMELVK